MINESLITESFLAELRAICGERSVKLHEPMSLHTTFRIGGPADVFAVPGDEPALVETVSLCRRDDVPFYLLGKGSNLLVSDTGWRGVMISTENLCRCESSRGRIRAEAGISLARLARLALEEELTGLEFAAGIPGSLGGAVVMNAGAYGSEMKDVLTGARVLVPDGSIQRLSREELGLGYRRSCVLDNGYIVLDAELALETGRKELIQEKMDELSRQRRLKQPLEYPSAGSMFKRPEGHFAGKLIDEAGLRGFAVGDARISEKHCGFVVNRGRASADDVLKLCDEVTRIVKEKFGVELEREVRYLE